MKKFYPSFQLLLIPLLVSLSIPAWASEWFVRPLGELSQNGDGNTYENAWRGLSSVKWGEGGVQAGDTLFVCGTHYEWGGLKVGASGTSDNNRIVINGDCPNDVGTIWATEYLPPAVWTSNGDGTYWAPLNKSGVRTGASGEPGMETLLIPVEDHASNMTTEGSIWYDAPNKRLYYNPIGAVKKVMAYWGNSAIALKGNDYVTITGSPTNRFKIRGGRCCNRGTVSVANGDNGDTAAEHVTIQYADIAFGGYTGVRSGVGSHHLHVLDNVFHDLPSGVYPVFNINDDPQSNNMVFMRNELFSGERNAAFRILHHNIADHHALGTMAGDDLIISENYIHDWVGMGINLYLPGGSETSTMKRFQITYNRIENLIGEDEQYTSAILTNGSSSIAFSSRMEGGLIAYNNIKNCPRGYPEGSYGYGGAFRIKSGSYGKVLVIQNNTVSDCFYGLYTRNVSPEGSLGFDFINNIITNPKPGGYFVFIGSHPNEKIVNFEHNLYSPLSNGRFAYAHADISFADWKNLSVLSEPDKDTSITLDPMLDENLMIATNSPAVGAGKTLGQEFRGCLQALSSWPSAVQKIEQDGDKWDIGTYCHLSDTEAPLPPSAVTIVE